MTTHNNKPLRIGLTGGIASGKSTVADMFAALGVPVIDTDVIAREVVSPGQPALEEIRELFGDGVFTADGTLDRAAVRRIVFGDAGARRRLEAILHPRIGRLTQEQADAAGGDYQVIVVPLLVESSLRGFVDRVLVVDCDENTQVARLLERDAETEEQARRILAAQSTRTERLAIADDVISNDGSLDDTSDQVRALHRSYLIEAAKREH
jgi:dephospho-CoA kinase